MKKLFDDDTFRIRLAVAAVLVVLVILFDVSGNTLAGISTERLYQVIAIDYGAVIDVFVQNLNAQ